MQGYAVPEHNSRGASLLYPRHQEALASSSYLWSCRKAEKLFLSHQTGNKDTFKHCRKFPFLVKKVRRTHFSAYECQLSATLVLSPLCDSRSDVVPLGTCMYLSCSWSLAQTLFPSPESSMNSVATWPAQGGPY